MACIDDDAVLEVLDGTVTDADRAPLLEHIETCEGCRVTVAAALSLVPDQTATVAPMRVGRYVVQDWIGEGAMGVVYRAHDPQIDRAVALKVVPPERCSPDRRARLLAEARAMGRLSHPNVLTVYDAGLDAQTVFIASELVEGSSLRTWLADTPRSVATIVDVFVQAGRGLAAAHRVGLVHLDFKPDNVLVSETAIKVADFGLARPTGEDGDGGTDGYMAPEQREGGRVDARTDQYAFCASLREALASHDHTEVPGRLRKVVARGMQPAPADRYEDFDALLEHLRPTDASRGRGRLVLAVLALGAIGVLGYGALASHREPAPHVVATPPAPSPALEEARALRAAGDLVAAQQRAESIAQQAHAADDPALEAEARLLLGKVLFATEGVDASTDALWRALALARTAARPELEAETLIALAAIDAEDPTASARALATLDDARRVLDDHALQAQLAHAADYAEGRVHFVTGRHEQALDTFERALEGATRALPDAHPHLAQYRLSVGNALGRLGRHDDARVIYLDAMQRASSTLGPDSARYGMMLAEVAAAQANMGAYASAVDDYDRALAILEGTLGPQSRLAMQSRGSRAFCLHRLGRVDEARSELERVVALAREAGEPIDVVRAYDDLGDLELSADRLPQARSAYEHAREWAQRDAPSTQVHARTLTRVGLALAAEDADASVRELLEHSVAIHETVGGDAIDRAEAEFALAQAVLHETGDASRAHELATTAASRLDDTPGLDGERRQAIEQWVETQFGEPAKSG